MSITSILILWVVSSFPAGILVGTYLNNINKVRWYGDSVRRPFNWSMAPA